MKRTISIIAIALLASGCLERDVRHDLYLGPDGSVEWMTLEYNVRSGHEDPAERDAEQWRYLMAAERSEHGMSEGLEALGGRQVRTRVLRDEVPFAVLTTARFDSIEELFRNILDESGMRHDVELEYGALVRHAVTGEEEVCQRLSIRFEEDGEGEWPENDVLNTLEDMQIVLTEGRFVAARGFELGPGGRTATLADEPEDGGEGEDEGVTSVWLAWTLDR